MDKLFTSSMLKIIAIISMTIDHIGVILIYPEFINACMVNGINMVGGIMPYEAKKLYYFYIATRITGRIAFPIFAFLIAEGALKTTNIKNYISRLLLFAFISEIPYDIATNGCFFDMGSQNIFWSLAAGLGIIMLIENKKSIRRPKAIFLSIILCTVSVFLSFSLGGIILILSFYIFRSDRKRLIPSVFISTFIMTMTSSFLQLFSFLAYPFIYLYNGKRGRGNKYLFYSYYPLHFLLLYLLT